MATPRFRTRTTFSISQVANVFPFDTTGAVGEDHIVVVINGGYRSYDKAGTELESTTLNALFEDTPEDLVEDDAFDPRVVYDAEEQRFFACATDGRRNTSGSQLLIAVSDSSDPTAGWTAFAIDTGEDILGVEQHFPDYPVIGLNADVVTITLTLDTKTGITPSHTHVFAYVFPKSDLLLATPTIANVQQLDISEGPIFTRHPSMDLGNGSLPHTLWKWDTNDTLDRLDVTLDGTYSIDEVASIAYTDAVGLDGEQPGGATDLNNSASSRISSSPVLTGGFFYLVVSSQSGTDSTIVVLKINATTNIIEARTTLSESGLDLIYPSIAVNTNGDIVVGCTSTGAGSEEFASAMIFVGKDEGGVMTFLDGDVIKAGERTYEVLDSESRNRWGDYSATVVDPADPNRFWTFQTWVFNNGVNDNGRKIQVTEIITNPSGFFSILGVSWLSSSTLSGPGRRVVARAQRRQSKFTAPTRPAKWAADRRRTKWGTPKVD